jgi:bifunctional non-homologous end joining protein LigD
MELEPAPTGPVAQVGGCYWRRRFVTGRKLTEYRRKRRPGRTPEPIPSAEPSDRADGRSFVVQEHHARALHWDFRLERDGVLVSWAVPKGIPQDTKRNHLAVQTEDHPLEYADFEGTIAAGEYGGGHVSIWDRGSYELETWSDREVKVVLHGDRTQGRFVLIHTDGKNWIMHRMGAAARPDWQPPQRVSPMLATPGALPPAAQDRQWAFEMKWDGVRAICEVDGGRITLWSRNDRDITVSYPELRDLGAQLGTTQAVLDGEIAVLDAHERSSFSRLQRRMHIANATEARRLADQDPVVYLIFDLLHLDGRSLLELPYSDRRQLLDGLELEGAYWRTPPVLRGGGAAAVRASRRQGQEGVIAKRRSSRYRPGRRSPDWVKIKNIRTQEVVVGGWRPGQGRRAGTIGSLLLGLPGDDGLRYIGNVGTGFTEETLADLMTRLRKLARRTSPFTEVPNLVAREAQWVTPRLVGEVRFTEWTGDGRLRHPSWRGLRPDKAVGDVRRES